VVRKGEAQVVGWGFESGGEVVAMLSFTARVKLEGGGGGWVVVVVVVVSGAVGEGG
jgi:hypothetical protein